MFEWDRIYMTGNDIIIEKMPKRDEVITLKEDLKCVRSVFPESTDIIMRLSSADDYGTSFFVKSNTQKDYIVFHNPKDNSEQELEEFFCKNKVFISHHFKKNEEATKKLYKWNAEIDKRVRSRKKSAKFIFAFSILIILNTILSFFINWNMIFINFIYMFSNFAISFYQIRKMKMLREEYKDVLKLEYKESKGLNEIHM